jgi:hypothetical protein
MLMTNMQLFVRYDFFCSYDVVAGYEFNLAIR